MQAAQRATGRAGLVVLDERVGDPRLAILALVERLQEVPAGVAEYVGLDHEDAWQIGIQCTHRCRVTFRIGSRGRGR